MTIPDLRIIQDLVIAGHGWSVLPDYLCAFALKAGRLAAWPRAARSHSAMICTWSGTRARCAIRALSTRATLSCACSIPPEDRPPAPGGPLPLHDAGRGRNISCMIQPILHRPTMEPP